MGDAQLRGNSVRRHGLVHALGNVQHRFSCGHPTDERGRKRKRLRDRGDKRFRKCTVRRPLPARGCRAIRAPIGVHGVCAGYTVNVVDAGKFSCQCGDALSRLDRRRTETSDSGKRELDGILFIDPVYAMTRRYECFSGACPKTGTKAARCVQCAAGALPAGLKLRIIKSNGIAASVSQAITRKQSMKESRSTWCCNWRYTYPAAAVVASGSE